MELGTFAVTGVARVTDAAAAAGARLGGCFLSRHDRGNPTDRELEKLLRRTLGARMMKTAIPSSRAIKNSVSYRMAAAEYADACLPNTAKVREAAGAYAELAWEIMLICGGGGADGQTEA
jgi:cellulose biosynthesis protein BcsQ